MDEVKGAATQPDFNCSPAYSKLGELSPRHNPVLSLGERCDHRIDRHRCAVAIPVFAVISTVNTGIVFERRLHGRKPGRRERTCGAHDVTKVQRKRDSSPPVPPLALIP